MGSSSSKRKEIERKPATPSTKSTHDLNTKNDNEIKFEEKRKELEKKYRKLQNDHKKLQESFVELKEKYDVENDDFIAHTKEVTDKLNDAIHEKTDQETDNGGKGCDFETIPLNDVDELLERLKENELVIENLKDELELVKICNDQEKAAIKEVSISKGLLLSQKYEEERKQLNMMWEQRLSEVRNNYLEDLTKTKDELTKEKYDIEQQLIVTQIDLVELEKKNQFLQTGFDEIRTRYENRESRFDDLEKIADLEGQLMVQAEELDKQKKLVKNLTNKVNQNGFASGEGNRGKKNTKKRRKNNNSTFSPHENKDHISTV